MIRWRLFSYLSWIGDVGDGEYPYFYITVNQSKEFIFLYFCQVKHKEVLIKQLEYKGEYMADDLKSEATSYHRKIKIDGII